MSATSIKVMVTGPNGGTTVYKSIRSAARALSGTGTDGPRTAVADAVWNGGGFVRNNWVQITNHPGGVARPRYW